MRPSPNRDGRPTSADVLPLFRPPGAHAPAVTVQSRTESSPRRTSPPGHPPCRGPARAAPRGQIRPASRREGRGRGHTRAHLKRHGGASIDHGHGGATTGGLGSQRGQPCSRRQVRPTRGSVTGPSWRALTACWRHSRCWRARCRRRPLIRPVAGAAGRGRVRHGRANPDKAGRRGRCMRVQGVARGGDATPRSGTRGASAVGLGAPRGVRPRGPAGRSPPARRGRPPARGVAPQSCSSGCPPGPRAHG